MQRYEGVPTRHFATPSVTVVWVGPRVFFANQHFQSGWREGDQTSPPPVPSYEDWKVSLGRPVGHAYNDATGLRFELRLSNQPYRFAIEANSDLWVPGDTIVYNMYGLDRWLVNNGVYPDDVASSPSGPLWYRLAVNWALNPMFSRLSFISLNIEEYRDWRSWGGDWPQKP